MNDNYRWNRAWMYYLKSSDIYAFWFCTERHVGLKPIHGFKNPFGYNPENPVFWC